MPSNGPSGYITTADLGVVLPVVIGPARDYIEKETFLTQMVTKLDLDDGDGLTINLPKWNTKFQAQILTEGVPIQNPQRLIPSSQQFTTYEVGAEIVITDQAVKKTPEAMMARAGRLMGSAMRRKKETDIVDLFPGLSRSLGAAGAPWSPNALSVGYNRLQAAAGDQPNAGTANGEAITAQEPAPAGSVSAVIHPFHYHDLLTSAATLGSNINSTTGYFPIEGFTEDIIRNYMVNRLYNVPLFLSNYIPIDLNDDAIGAIFSRETFLLINTSLDMRVEKDRDINLRAWDVVITSEYGVGELEDQFGFKMPADASVPVIT
jgi:hypothetical protein